MKTKLALVLSIFLALTLSPAGAAVRYVNLANPSPAPPYTNWASAATNIQNAIDSASASDEIVVTNGVHATGGRAVVGTMTNRVAVTMPVTVRSVNGPEVTVIQGYQVPGATNGDGAVRCVYLRNGAALVGFTLTNGATRTLFDFTYEQNNGGGVWCESANEVVSNCVLTGNSAALYGGGAYEGTLNNCRLTGNSAGNQGGGAYYGTLNNCTLTGNSAYSFGGGASGGTLNNCVLTGNSAATGGGAAGGGLNGGTLNHCTITGNSAANFAGGVIGQRVCPFGCVDFPAILTNCIVYSNQAPIDANYSIATFKYSCATPLPDGIGNFDSPPLFVDPEARNFHLQPNSPCINSGINTYAPVAFDVDGNPRIAGGTVDVGAYEFQSPQSLLSYAWLQQFGLPTDGSADDLDLDGDHFTNFQEWRAGTDPTNAVSALRLFAPERSGPDLLLRWSSVPGRSYFLERSTNLTIGSFMPIARDLAGQADSTMHTDSNVATNSQRYYRVRVE